MINIMINFIKENWVKALFFIIGVVITIYISKLFDKIIPDNPTIIKGNTDTITLLHKYSEFKENINPNIIKDKVNLNITKKTLGYNDTNTFDNIHISTYSIDFDLNKPIIIKNHKWKGYTQGDISNYAIIECPNPESKLLIFNIEMLNSDILNDISFFQCIVYKNVNEQFHYISENYYEVKSSQNMIGIVNNLDKGSYIFEIGFMFKEDLTNDYPKFYRMKCNIQK